MSCAGKGVHTYIDICHQLEKVQMCPPTEPLFWSADLWSHLAERFTVSSGGFDKLSRNSESLMKDRKISMSLPVFTKLFYLQLM